MLHEAVARYRVLVALTATGWLLAGAGCERSSGLTDEGVRVWGRHKLDEDVKARAAMTIDAYKVDVDPESRARMFQMSFDEVVARFGFLRLQSKARFELSRNGQSISVFEQTVIEHGQHGSWRVLQKDKDGDITREVIVHNGMKYLRNGPTGQLRFQGIHQDRAQSVREQAWSPLRAYTSYYGERLGLVQVGAARVARRRAARYRFTLMKGPKLIGVPGMKGRREPLALSGDLYVDEKTGVPSKVKLRGKLRIPSAPDSDVEPGELKIFLELTIAPTKGDPIKPEDFVPTVAHRPVDLDPLRFLKADTRTSTVIGGGN